MTYSIGDPANQYLEEGLEPAPVDFSGERLIQFASEHLVTEVLIQPQLYTLQQCVRNMLGSFTKHRHVVHGGYTFAGSGENVCSLQMLVVLGFSLYLKHS